MKKSLIIILLSVLTISLSAQKKTIMLDVSHDVDTAYTRVNPNMFDEYKDIVEKKIGADLIVNKDKEIDKKMLSEVDLLIVLSPLDRKRESDKNNLTAIERQSIVEYVKNGGKLIFFMDEEDRVDMQAFGGNDIVKPFGMEYGLDLPMKPDIGATSLITDAVKHQYELSYSGSRSIKGGTPISIRNGVGEYVHGAYVKCNNGGTIVAFGETMTGIFMGGVEMKLPNGMTIIWKGKDDKLFMQELMEWLIKNSVD